jgi:hypothetical protein
MPASNSPSSITALSWHSTNRWISAKWRGSSSWISVGLRREKQAMDDVVHFILFIHFIPSNKVWDNIIFKALPGKGEGLFLRCQWVTTKTPTKGTTYIMFVVPVFEGKQTDVCCSRYNNRIARATGKKWGYYCHKSII